MSSRGLRARCASALAFLALALTAAPGLGWTNGVGHPRRLKEGREARPAIEGLAQAFVEGLEAEAQRRKQFDGVRPWLRVPGLATTLFFLLDLASLLV